jgi:outer membrane receptor protein involved in Fe transport
MVAETPEWQYGGRAQFEVGPFEFGVQGKYVDDRFATDVNDVIVPGYALFDADARFSFAQWGLERTYLQFNVINIFDERYIGSIGTQLNAARSARPARPAAATPTTRRSRRARRGPSWPPSTSASRAKQLRTMAGGETFFPAGHFFR